MSMYGTLDGALAYHDARGNSAWSAAGVDDTKRTEALVRGSAALDVIYGSRFPGVRTDGRDQLLGWPRIGSDGNEVQDIDGNDLPSDAVPVEIENAAYELGLRELAEPGSTTADLDRGGLVKRLKAGSAEIEYEAGATANIIFQIVDGILAPLIGARPGSTTSTLLLRA